MENFLLLFDEIDDLVATLRMLWPQFLSFVLACGIFTASILIIMRWPMLTVGALSLALLFAALPAPRLKASLRFKTDL